MGQRGDKEKQKTTAIAKSGDDAEFRDSAHVI